MGGSVVAKCPCGYEGGSLVGGGMMTFMTTCYFPAYCENCRELVQINVFAKRLRCPKCRRAKVTPYDDPALCAGNGDREVAGWNVSERLGRDLRLHDGEYLCPACGEFTLRFVDGRLEWD